LTDLTHLVHAERATNSARRKPGVMATGVDYALRWFLAGMCLWIAVLMAGFVWHMLGLGFTWGVALARLVAR
jgi:hypothetical protein